MLNEAVSKKPTAQYQAAGVTTGMTIESNTGKLRSG